MSDIFREVDEALKEDRVKAFWKKHGNLVIACVLVVVLGTAGFVWWRGEQQSAQVEETASLVSALVSAQQAEDNGLVALNDVAAATDADVSALARLAAATAAMDNGDRETAVSLLDQVANDSAIDPVLRDAATLRSVYYRLDTGDIGALNGILDRYADADSPWRPWALEMRAMLLVRDGDTAAARDILLELADDEDSPAPLAAQAAELAAALTD